MNLLSVRQTYPSPSFIVKKKKPAEPPITIETVAPEGVARLIQEESIPIYVRGIHLDSTTIGIISKRIGLPETEENAFGDYNTFKKGDWKTAVLITHTAQQGPLADRIRCHVHSKNKKFKD